MIKLVDLLKEVQGRPKAIFMAGPAGAGKTFTLNKLGVTGFTNINVDTDYEELLKKEIGKQDLSSMTPDELSIAGKLMGQARVTTREKEEQAIANSQNIILDATGAASKPLLKKKEELEAKGYQTFMILIYVSPMTSLKRNAERSRNLVTSAVLSSWKGVASNIDTYKQAFGDNLVLINNDPKDVDKSFSPESIFKLYPQPKGKEKSPEEKAKSELEKEKLNQDIKSLLDIEREFDTFDEAKQKINNFINS
jgi:predicted ATPase